MAETEGQRIVREWRTTSCRVCHDPGCQHKYPDEADLAACIDALVKRERVKVLREAADAIGESMTGRFIADWLRARAAEE